MHNLIVGQAYINICFIYLRYFAIAGLMHIMRLTLYVHVWPVHDISVHSEIT